MRARLERPGAIEPEPPAGPSAVDTAATQAMAQAAAAPLRVKICGITSPEDALLAAELGADFLGLNFYRESPRYVSVERARAIAAAVAGRVRLVGVFVNAAAAEVAATAAEVGLDLLQFHGDEPPEELAPFAPRAIKAIRLEAAPGASAASALARFGELWGFLFDAPHRSLYGGTGLEWSYENAGVLRPQRRFFLAGGIGPDNLARAVASCRPYGVDVCSRVESAPGRKDPAALRRLLAEARRV